MNKVAIIYASQNGTTQKIAEKMKEMLENKGNEVNILNVNQIKNIHIEDYDFIGIGSPTYMSRPSYEIMDVLDTLKGIKNKKVFTFSTYGTEIGDGANWLRKKIKRMGALDIGHFACKGRNLFSGYVNRGYLFSPDSPNNDEVDAAAIFIESVLVNAKSSIPTNPVKYDPNPHFLYRFERFVTNRILIKHIYSHFFSVNKNLCISCDRCLNNCPMKNISKNDKNQKIWGPNCILCLNCDISCPKKAVINPISWFIFAPFLTINIRKAIRKGIIFEGENN